jgi:enoyl-CoA hydratase
MGISHSISEGVAEVVVDNPPVNALTVAGWYELADVVRRLGADPEVRALILTAEGRGFNAGVDIKEIQASEGYGALVGANRGCYAAFAAVYDCEVPVIAAVHGYCLGGGIGLVGNADIIVASDDATFGLPEVDRGALGAATHLARLVPQHKMRAMMYLANVATAEELHHYGSVLEVVPRDQLRATARELAARIAAKNATVIRRAKESINGIDPVDVKRSYRFEQGFTFELNLSGVSDEARQAFVDKRPASTDR